MPPHLALSIWLVLLLVLFWLDPAKDTKVSVALWVPLIWMFFLGSRGLSIWLGTSTATGIAQSLEEGDPLNRAVELGLVLLAVGILVSRSFRWGEFFARNWALTAYLLFALVSVVWSDFPFPAFKKWFRDLGNYAVILVVLSDPQPLEAVRTVLRRLGYLLIPLSVVLIKYFPDIAREYDPWTGAQTFSGVTTTKNMLGIICLVCGIYFVWDTVVRWPDRKNRRVKQIILVNGAMIGMVVWLLNICSSATSITCLILASMVILLAHSKVVQRRPGLLTVTIPCVFLLYALLAYGFNLKGEFAGAVGRDPTLSGRTVIWSLVLREQPNPLLGAGYESFWLGPRLQRIWAGGMGKLNESHNGYLEVYLNLGWAGVFLLFLFVATTYRNICKKFRPFSCIASLSLAIWIAFLFHNNSEVDFRSGMMWLAFVFGAFAASEVDRRRVSEPAASRDAETAKEFAASEGMRQPSPLRGAKI